MLPRHYRHLERSLPTYLAHVVDGRSMNAIARDTGLAASTVMRRVRFVENLRDRPEIDAIVAQAEMRAS